MSTLFASFIVLALAVAAMAVGVIFGRSPIRGSCGGVAGGGCAVCGGQCERRASRDEGANGEKDAC